MALINFGGFRFRLRLIKGHFASEIQEIRTKISYFPSKKNNLTSAHGVCWLLHVIQYYYSAVARLFWAGGSFSMGGLY